MKLQIRCSELSKIMTDPQKKTEKLSVGAKALIDDKIKWMTMFPENQDDAGFYPEISSKYLDKGNFCEQDSIDLFNLVSFSDHKKYEGERKVSACGILSGQCDIFTGNSIIDIKSSWSLATFPFFKDVAAKDAKLAGYDCQIYGYQLLWGVNIGQIAYCMTTTPFELCSYEDSRIHEVDHIDVGKRVVVADFNITNEIVDQINQKLIDCNEYFNNRLGDLR